MDAFISVKFTSKGIETHLKYMLPFSDMDEGLAYVTDHLISPKSKVQRIAGQFVNKIHDFSHRKKHILI